MSSLFYAEIRVCRKQCHAKTLSDRSDWFSSECWECTLLVNCYLGFSKFWRFWKLWKIIFKKYYLKKWDFSRIFENGINAKNPCQVYTCTQFQVHILENARVLAFWWSKTAIFTLFPAISAFFQFLKFVLFWLFKKCSRVIFRVLDKKITQKHISRRPNPKFSVWPFFDLVTLNDLVCLFIGVLGRFDCSSHFAPITQVIGLTRGVCHGEFDVRDIGEKSTRLDPDRIISKEMTESDVCGNVSEVTSTANTVPRGSQQCVCYL